MEEDELLHDQTIQEILTKKGSFVTNNRTEAASPMLPARYFRDRADKTAVIPILPLD